MTTESTERNPVSTSRIAHHLRPIWTPEDTERLRADLAALPVDTDDSPILRLVCAEQGIEL